MKKYLGAVSVIIVVLLFLALSIGCSQRSAEQNQPAGSPENRSTASAPTPTAKTADELMQEGDDLVSDEKYQESIAKYEEAIKIDPEMVDAYTSMAESYKSIGQYDKAIETTNKIIDKNPKDTGLIIVKAGIYNYSKEYDKAIETYKMAIELGDKRSATMIGLASVYENKKDYAEAEKIFDSITKNNPNDVGILTAYGDYWFRKACNQFEDEDRIKCYQKMADIYEKAFDKAKPDDDFEDKPSKKYQVGIAYMEKSKFSKNDTDKQKAIEAFNEFLKMNPKHPFAETARNSLKQLKAK